MTPAIRYTLSITEPARHLLDVTLDIDNVSGSELELKMAAWTPGSYLLREYARLVRNFSAEADGRPLSWEKTDKLTWRIAADGAQRISVRYRVYGYELTVRTNHVDATHAHVIPAATFMYLPERAAQQHELTVQAPDGWQISTGLDLRSGTTYVAEDLDQLIDSPLEIGQQRRFEFEVQGKKHALVIWGQGNDQPERMVEDTKKIVEAASALFGPLPYEHYTFLLMLAGANAGGGLEHRNSTSLLLPRHSFGTSKGYERFLGLTAHEFIHTWIVKRLLPEGLVPFDYGAENYTRMLWVMEGFTEYYTDIIVRRAGLITPERYRERLADDIVTLQTTPGRLLHSLEESSFDTWIKFYRPDETTPNTTISYYLKGALAAACLDLEIRRRTDNRVALDDVVRQLYGTYAGSGRGIPERDGVRNAVEELTGSSFQDFFASYIAGVEELPFETSLGAAGITLSWGHKDADQEGQPQPTLGLRTRVDQGRLRVTHVIDGGSADGAGLAPDDELVAIDGWQLTDGNFKERLSDYRVGDTAKLTLFRREELLELELTFVTPAQDKLTLERVGQPSAQQRAIYEGWMQAGWDGGEASGTARATAVGTEEVVRTSERQPT